MPKTIQDIAEDKARGFHITTEESEELWHHERRNKLPKLLPSPPFEDDDWVDADEDEGW